MARDSIIETARKEGRRQLTEVEAKDLIRGEGFPVVRTLLANTQKQAVNLAREIGFPVALKIASPDIIHKSDFGGVRLGLRNASQVAAAFSEILTSVESHQPGLRIEGVTVQEMAKPGIEVIIGMNKDPQFGPVIMFGLGGILVELLKDISFRIIPLTPNDAAEMIRETKGFPLLQGYRGHEGADVDKLQALIVKVARFIEKTPGIKELDLNPVIASKTVAVVADARIVLEDYQETTPLSQIPKGH
jgi:acyl-CoA synthetase (NDP forming)